MASLLVLAAAGPGATQSAPVPPKKHGRNIPGTPLDTIMSTHLTTTVPEPQSFVRDSRPDPKTLDYTPLSGVTPEPERPAPRDAANVAALQAELEQSGARNAKRARGMTKPHRARASR